MWWIAASMGLVGSLHCLGMCSPLVMIITTRQPFPIARLLYNLGRILTYGVLGMAAGTFGSLFNMSGIQQNISLVLGIALIVVGISGTNQLRIPLITRSMHRLMVLVKSKFSLFLA